MSKYNNRATFRAHLLAKFPNQSEFEAEEVGYLNIGTWIPNWRENHPSLSVRTIRSFVRFEFSDGVYTYKTLEWPIWAESKAPSIILEPETFS